MNESAPEDWPRPARELWSAYRRGETHRDGTIDAGHLRHLLLAAPTPSPGHQAALRLAGVTIEGGLDLTDKVLEVVLSFEDCTFTDPVEMQSLSLPALGFDRCRMRGVNADRLSVGRVLKVAGSVLNGTLSLRDARVGTQVDLSESTIIPAGYDGRPVLPGSAPHRTPQGYVGIDAENIVVGGDFRATRLTWRGAMFLNLARIDGAIALHGATVPDGFLQAPSMRCTGLYARSGFTLNGTMNLYGSEINGPVDLSGATLTNPGHVSFGGWGITVSGVFAADADTKLSGTLDLHAATLRGGLQLSGMTCDEPGETGSLHLARSVVSAGLIAEGCVLGGPVDLSHAQIAASVEFEGVHIGGGFNADNITVADDLHLCRARVEGAVTLRGARVNATVDLRDTLLGTDGEGFSVHADGLTAFQLIFEQRTPPGAVNLGHAVVEVLCDNVAAWPARATIDAFVYHRLRSDGMSVAQRLGVLRRATPQAQPQPYEQLAAVYRTAGRERHSRQVLREKLRRESHAGRWPRRVWGAIQDVAIGYGYLPGRAAAIFSGILLGASAYYGFLSRGCSPGQPGLCPVKPGEHPTWDPLLYTLDVLVPILDLGHEKAFDPVGWDKAVMVTVLASGWVFATTLVAAAGRALSRQ